MTRGWHFCADRNGSPFLRDGTPCPTTGAAEVFDGEPAMCERGLHWSARAIDALSFAPGPWVRMVEGEPTAIDSDKVVGRERLTVAGPVNVNRILRGFAGLCALRALRRYADAETRNGCMPMVRCALTYWRTGVWPEDRDDALVAVQAATRTAARYAVRDATCAAARYTSRAAARAAAWDAAWAAARAAAWNAAWDAARYAVRDAAWDAAWDTELDATWYTAWDAARNAERDWQNRVLHAMLRKALEMKQ